MHSIDISDYKLHSTLSKVRDNVLLVLLVCTCTGKGVRVSGYRGTAVPILSELSNPLNFADFDGETYWIGSLHKIALCICLGLSIISIGTFNKWEKEEFVGSRMFANCKKKGKKKKMEEEEEKMAAERRERM